MARNHQNTATPNRKKAPVTVALDAKAIGLRIRTARKAIKWDITSLARVVECAYSTVASWECGSRIPQRDGLVKLAVALRRSLDFLVFGTGERRTRHHRTVSRADRQAA